MATFSEVVDSIEISEKEKEELDRVFKFMIANFGEEMENLAIATMITILELGGRNIESIIMSSCFTSMYAYRRWLIENGVNVSVAENKFTETKTEE